MKEFRKCNEYRNTTNSRVYNILRLHGQEVDCCLRCERRRSHKWYHVHKSMEEYGHAKPNKLPNWKLVSKGRKQWYKKPLKLNQHFSNWNQEWELWWDVKW